MQTVKSHWAIIPLAGIVTLLSAIFWLWPNGLKGALMAMVIAAGVWWLSRQRAQGTGMAVAVGLAFGLAGGALVALFQWAVPNPLYRGELAEFYPPVTPLWALVASGLLYGLFLVPFYWSIVRPAKSAFFWILTAGVGCGIIRTGIALTYYPEPGMAVMTGIFGGVPFGILWMWVARAWGARVVHDSVTTMTNHSHGGQPLTSPPGGAGNAAA